MRVVLWLVAAVAVLWTGYWFVGSRSVEKGIEAWAASQSDSGLEAGYEGLSVGGFPGRFDVALTAPHLADPMAGTGWSAPDLLVTALAYAPWHLIAIFPQTQTVTLPDQTVTLTAEKLLGSVIFAPGTSMALQRTRLSGNGLELGSTFGWRAGAEQLNFATAVLQDARSHEIGLEMLKVTPDPALSAAMPDLPSQIDRLHLDASVTFDRPVDGTAASTPLRVTAIEVKDLSGIWGDAVLAGSGRITADEFGRAEGQIDLRLDHWRKLMPLLVATGTVTPEVAPTWERMLDYLARDGGGDPDVLQLPLTYRDGRASLGPLPLGPAPQLN
ncbi:DUF2125 domain-containing protein [Tabrizicola sp. J26]|nr:DUF2125 domain-containing protein [Tabrizicola rongguiensis]